jgi:glycosyltransferase involved in cell wall biosynthesis
MNVTRRINRRLYQFDFCCSMDREGDFDDELRSMGCRIIPCRRGKSLRDYSRRLAAVVREGNYDLVHSHLYTLSGIVLRVAEQQGVPHRFAHVHSSGDGQKSTPVRIAYRKVMRWLVRRHATQVLACAGWAMASIMGAKWKRDPRTRVVYYGLDLEPFAAPADPDGVRRELDIDARAPLLIHVGRFEPAKNHRGLVEIFRCVHGRLPEARLLLVGGGALMGQTRQLVQEAALTDYVLFVGVRPDVARLMKAADVMVMPSIREGMPLTLLEATAAGLPTIITDMPGMREANEICCEGRLLPGGSSPDRWADVILETLAEDKPDQDEALARMRQSPFTNDAAVRCLEQLYSECVGR